MCTVTVAVCSSVMAGYGWLTTYSEKLILTRDTAPQGREQPWAPQQTQMNYVQLYESHTMDNFMK